MLTQKDYHGKKRYFVSDPKPADSAFFDLSHQLASDFPELRARLGKLVKRNAGKSLLEDVCSQDTSPRDVFSLYP